MKKIFFLTLLICFCSNLCRAQEAVNDTYSVGFQYFKTHDKSRQYFLNEDSISRPLLIHFWYPAHKNNEKEHLCFKDYIDLIAIRENFDRNQVEIDASTYNFVNAYAEFAKQHLKIDSHITTEQIINSPVLAQYGIAMAKSKEKFPLLIYTPSNSKSAIQNHMLCEHLASHGFMIISVGSAGKTSLRRPHMRESILAQVTDMEFILHYFEDSLNIEYTHLGLVDFSSGGLANTIFQMKNNQVKAILSLDGGQEYGAYPSLFSLDEFDLIKTNIPYCLLVNNYKNFSIYPFYNSVLTKEKFRFRMPLLDHNGFVSYWNFFNSPSSNSKDCQVCSTYDYICETACLFFNKYLNHHSLKTDTSDIIFPANEFIIADTIDHSKITQLCNIILSSNNEEGIRFLNKNQDIFIHQENEINILSRMFRDGNIELCLQLLLFNVQRHPNSWKAHYELANTYKITGDLILSKKALSTALNLNPKNPEINKLLDEINTFEKK